MGLFVHLCYTLISMVLRYLTLLGYPSGLANRLQVIKMSEALSRRCDFKLYVREFPQAREKIFEDYHIRNAFQIEPISKGFVSWPRSFWLALCLRKLIHREAGEIIFYIRDLLLAFILIFISRKFRKNFFFELHSLGRFPHPLYRLVLSWARGIISTNEHKKDFVINKYHIRADKILVVPNGVDLGIFEELPSKEILRKELGLPNNRPIIMYVGSSQYWKGVDLINKLSRSASNYCYVAVGVSTEGHDNLLVYKSVAWKKVSRYLRAADILIAPYPKDIDLSRLWTSPMKIFEYMASGTPIVASDTPALREILDENTALLVEGDSPEAYEHAIDLSFKNYEEVQRRSSEAKKRAQKYDWQKRAEAVLNFVMRA